MKVYNVLYESHLEDSASVVETEVETYANKKDAEKALQKAIYRELVDANYDEDDVEINRDGKDYVSFCWKLTDDWFYRITIYEREVL